MAANHSVSIPMSEPDLSEREVAAAARVLRSGALSRGPAVPAFERAFADYVGGRHGIAVSSGTAALHLSLVAAGVTEGDFVITSPFSFVASANCILYERATPIFVDVDRATGNLDLSLVEAALEDVSAGRRHWLPPAVRRRSGKSRVKAVLPVHVFGRPVDMTALMPVARRWGAAVIEDACEAVGARWGGRHAGAFGDAGCFGFYPNKPMTTGEGGMIVTSDESVADMCRSLRNQGRENARAGITRLGYSYRLPDIAAAIGSVQLSRLESLQRKRDRVARWYDDRLSGLEGLERPAPAAASARLSWFTYVVRFDDERRRSSAAKRMAAAGIDSRVYFPTIPLEPLYVARFGYRRGDFPNAERWSNTSLALPFSGLMTERTVDRVCAVLRDSMRRTRSVIVR